MCYISLRSLGECERPRTNTLAPRLRRPASPKYGGPPWPTKSKLKTRTSSSGVLRLSRARQDCPTALPPTTCLSAACYRHAESAGSGSRPEVSYGALSPAPAAIEQGVSDVRKFIALGQPEGSVRAIKVESVYVSAFGLLHVNHCTTSSSRRV